MFGSTLSSDVILARVIAFVLFHGRSERGGAGFAVFSRTGRGASGIAGNIATIERRNGFFSDEIGTHGRADHAADQERGRGNFSSSLAGFAEEGQERKVFGFAHEQL